MKEKTIEEFDVMFNQELINQQKEDNEAYQIWLGKEGNASKENLDEFYEWLEAGGYEEMFKEFLNENE